MVSNRSSTRRRISSSTLLHGMCSGSQSGVGVFEYVKYCHNHAAKVPEPAATGHCHIATPRGRAVARRRGASRSRLRQRQERDYSSVAAACSASVVGPSKAEAHAIYDTAFPPSCPVGCCAFAARRVRRDARRRDSGAARRVPVELETGAAARGGRALATRAECPAVRRRGAERRTTRRRTPRSATRSSRATRCGISPASSSRTPGSGRRSGRSIPRSTNPHLIYPGDVISLVYVGGTAAAPPGARRRRGPARRARPPTGCRRACVSSRWDRPSRRFPTTRSRPSSRADRAVG